LIWRPAGGASRQSAALGGIVLDQLPPAETPAPAVPLAAPVPPHPVVAPPPGPIPHGSLPETAPAAASDAKTGKPAPLGASVDAARLVN
jgi:HemY protein